MVAIEAQHDPRQQHPGTGSSRRLWLFRVVAILIGLTPFVALEGLCAVLDWGRPSLDADPFVGFRAVRPLFVLNADRTRWEIPRGRQKFFCPESFAAAKADNEYRVFCLGGSTVQGNPYAVETSFSTWLEISLAAADPSAATGRRSTAGACRMPAIA